MLWLTLQYLLFIFAACCGVLQLVARWNKITGFSFFQSKTATYVFATLTIGGSYVWFFISGDRNIPGLEGAQQFASFLPSVALAIIFTAAISALVHRKDISRRNLSWNESGLDALKKMNYFNAIKYSFKHQARKGKG